VAEGVYNGEYYLEDNPQVVQNALNHYIKKLDHTLTQNPINPITIPNIFEEDIPKIKERVEKTLEKLASEDPNVNHTLERDLELIFSSLRIYRKDLEKCKRKINREFYDEIPNKTALGVEIREISDAFERLAKP